MLQTEKGLLAGRFEIQEKNRVILKVDVGFGQQVNLVLSYRFEEAQLFLTDESKGNSSRYVRINSGSPAPTTVPPSAGTMPPAPQTVRQGTVQTLKRDVQADVLRNLRLFAAAADQYFLENGVSQTTYDQLVGPDKYIKQVTAVDGENYRNLVLKQGHELRVTTASGLTVRYAP